MVDFHGEDYTSLTDSVFGTVTLHDSTAIPDTRIRRYLIFPGYFYQFSITEQLNKLLPPPFDTQCFAYVLNNKPKYSETNYTHPYLDAPLSQQDCLNGCLAKRSIQTCKCWPPEVPFLLGFDDHPLIDNTKWCDWKQDAIENGTTWKQLFLRCFVEHEPFCNAACPRDCE